MSTGISRQGLLGCIVKFISLNLYFVDADTQNCNSKYHVEVESLTIKISRKNIPDKRAHNFILEIFDAWMIID